MATPPSSTAGSDANIPARRRERVDPLRQLQLSRLHHGPRGRHPPTGGRPSPPRRGGERHPRPEIRCGTEPSTLRAFCRQRPLDGRAGAGPQPGPPDRPHPVWASGRCPPGPSDDASSPSPDGSPARRAFLLCISRSAGPTALPSASRLTPLANDPPSSSASQSEVSSTRAGWTDDGPLTPPHPCPWLASGLPAPLTSESRPVHHPLSFLLLYFSAVTTPFSGSGLIHLGDGRTCLPHPLISTGLERSLAPVPPPPVLDNVPSSIGAISPPNGPAPDPFKSKTARPRTPFKSKLGM